MYLNHCYLFCARIWPFFLFPSLLLVPLLYFLWHPIETAIAANVQQSLDKDHPWARAETFNRGRDLLLDGVAPGDDEIGRAMTLAASIKGVRRVDFAGRIGAPNPIQLGIKFAADQIELSGTVDSQASIDALMAVAQQNYAPKQLSNRLSVGDNIATMTTATDLISTSVDLKGISGISIDGDNLTIEGVVQSGAMRTAYSRKLHTVFKGEVNNQLVIIAPPVENDECQELLDELLVKARINFETMDATISADSFPLIDNIAATARRCKDALFEIAGYTDSTGSDEFNMILSVERAQAVADRLVQLGLDSWRFIPRGYGRDQAIADNTTKSGRAANRRIEFRLTN